MGNYLSHLEIKEGFSNDQNYYNGFPSGYFKIRSRLNNKCLDVSGGKTEDGTEVALFDCHDGLNQQWYVDKMGRVINRLANKCLSIQNASIKDGTPIIIIGDNNTWVQDGDENTQWVFNTEKNTITSINTNKLISFDESDVSDIENTVTRVYTNQDINSSAQRWYFERIERKNDTKVFLTDENKDLSKPTTEVHDRLPDQSDRVTIQLWFRMKRFSVGDHKPIVWKGTSDRLVAAPYIGINSTSQNFVVHTSTTHNKKDGCGLINYKIATDSWINIAVVISGNNSPSPGGNMKFYVSESDGETRLIKDCKMDGFYSPNLHKLNIGHQVSDGLEVRDIRVSNYDLKLTEIQDQVRRSKRRVLGTNLNQRVTSNITVNTMSSNGTFMKDGKQDPESDPYKGQLNQTGSWQAASADSKYYLEATFDQVYKVTRLYMQGRSNSPKWVERVIIKYQHPISGEFLRYGTTYRGNSDSNTVQEIAVNFMAKTVRVYPQTWKTWPAMRIGFDGTTSGLDKCQSFLKLSQDAKNDMEKKTNLEKYNSECRKITFAEHLKRLEKLKKKMDTLYDEVDKQRVTGEASGKEKAELQKEVRDLKKKIKQTRLDAAILAAKKCPPSKKCVPIIDYSPKRLPSINDFDIRTHRDFHKYVLASNVRSPDGKLGVKIDKAKSAPVFSKTKSKSDTISNIKNELSECQSKFKEAFTGKKINANNINMIGGAGGIYGTMCTLNNGSRGKCESKFRVGKQVVTTTHTARKAKTNPIPIQNTDIFKNSNDNRSYDIRNHIQFDDLMKDYMLKSSCDAMSSTVKKAPKKQEKPKGPNCKSAVAKATKEHDTQQKKYKKEIQKLKAQLKTQKVELKKSCRSLLAKNNKMVVKKVQARVNAASQKKSNNTIKLQKKNQTLIEEYKKLKAQYDSQINQNKSLVARNRDLNKRIQKATRCQRNFET